VIGIPLILLGAFLNIWADKIFKKIDTTVKPLKEPSSFSEEGPFEFTRHPMYLGSISILLGISLGLGNTLSFINPFLMFIILNYIFIPYEENSLEKKFKEEYLKYKEKVGRWV
jgi:protein-S-isoprenylcysteine O-methyltransferase Ste14